MAIEYRSAENQADQLPVLVATDSPAGSPDRRKYPDTRSQGRNRERASRLRRGHRSGQTGLVNSINRPGGNATGVSFLSAASATKRLELLSQFAPKATTIAVLLNPNTPEAAIEQKDVEAMARAAGQQLIIVEAGRDGEIEVAFATFVERKAGALFVGNGAFLLSPGTSGRAGRSPGAARSLSTSEYTTAGGLMSYGANQTDAYRLAGTYAGRILKGDKPAELPVQQSTKFDLIINLKTAKDRGKSGRR